MKIKLEYISLITIILFVIGVVIGVFSIKIREHGGYQTIMFSLVLTLCSLTYKIITRK